MQPHLNPKSRIDQFRAAAMAVRGAFGLPAHGLYGVLLLDALGTIGYCNEDFARMTGLATADLLGAEINDVIPDLPLSCKSAEFNRAVVRSKFADGEWCGYSLRGRGGARRQVELRVSLIRLEDGSDALVLEATFAAGPR